MKIITNDAVYVQKNDISYLNSFDDIAIPASIYMKVYGNGTVYVNDSNRYEFVKFEEKTEIEFFKGLDWMVDYNEVKDLSEQETIELLESIRKEQNTIATEFNSMSEEEKRNNFVMMMQSEQLAFKYYSLRDVLWFKQEHLAMELPEGIDYPASYAQKKRLNKQTPKKK